MSSNPRLLLAEVSLACAGLIACADDTGTASVTDTTTTSTTSSATDTETTGASISTTGVITTGAPTTGVSTTGAPTTAAPTSTSSSSGGVDACTTLVCGSLSVCCAAGEECVGAACEPACASGVRCGEGDSICCGEGEVCLGEACALPLGPCQGPGDCAAGQFCDPVLGQCLPLPDPLGCDLAPDTVDVAPGWEWTADQVASTPMVADVDGDGLPDVIVSTTAGGDAVDWPTGEIVVLDGVTGAEKWRIAHDPDNLRFGSHGRATIAVGDVSGDGVPDIVYAGRPDANKRSPVHAVDGQGNLLWTSRLPDQSEARLRVDNGAAALANLDGDPEAEVVFGAAIFDHDGLLVWNQGGEGGLIGTPLLNGSPVYPGGLATLADLDGDAAPELVTGREAWKIDWVEGDPPTVTLSLFWANNMNPNALDNNDGWPAVADLDGDGKPEVVLTAHPRIRVISGQTGQLWCGIDPTDAACAMNPALRTQPIAIKGGNLGGPATIADFDGDGRPEAAITGGVAFAVYDFNRPGEEVVKPQQDPMPVPGAMYARWSFAIQDNSSAATGASAFDFGADGAAEVIQQDECFTRVLDGATGEVLLALMNSSATIHEYPLVVDVDGDGASELLTVANLSIPQSNAECAAKTPRFTTRQGVFAYRPQGSLWAPARDLWTQHTYHVTNADDDGNPPPVEQANWTAPGLNNFRQGSAGAVTLNAPDLALSLAGELAQCPAELVLVATVHNGGTLGVPAGIEVEFYEGLDAGGTLLGTAQTSEAIVPGGSTQVTWTVPGPPAGMPVSFFAVVDPGEGAVLECDEGNNAALLALAACP